MKRRVERRKHIRFQANKGAYAVLWSDANKLGQIKDISRGGLAFHYIADGKTANGSFEVDIFLTDNDFCLKNVPAKTVLDSQADTKASFSSVPMRRLSIQFGEMIHEQKSKLDYFLKHHTSGAG